MQWFSRSFQPRTAWLRKARVSNFPTLIRSGLPHAKIIEATLSSSAVRLFGKS
jgi:hypothetical protein